MQDSSLKPTIKDFSDAEQWAVNTTLKERWPKLDLDIQLADVEIKMYPHERELTVCPALFWQVGETSFVVIKVGDRAYRSQFYYKGFQQYGTGKSEFDDIADCITTLLQVHADKESDLRRESEKNEQENR
jgi:hypothetical protein